MMKAFCKTIAFVMALCMLITLPALQPVFADVGQDAQLSKLYLKEVKMFYADNADDARVACESEG